MLPYNFEAFITKLVFMLLASYAVCVNRAHSGEVATPSFYRGMTKIQKQERSKALMESTILSKKS